MSAWTVDKAFWLMLNMLLLVLELAAMLVAVWGLLWLIHIGSRRWLVPRVKKTAFRFFGQRWVKNLPTRHERPKKKV